MNHKPTKDKKGKEDGRKEKCVGLQYELNHKPIKEKKVKEGRRKGKKYWHQ